MVTSNIKGVRLGHLRSLNGLKIDGEFDPLESCCKHHGYLLTQKRSFRDRQHKAAFCITHGNKENQIQIIQQGQSTIFLACAGP